MGAALFQKTGINTFDLGFEGDISTPQYLQSQIASAVVDDTNGINVGTFVWQELNSNRPFQILQSKGSNIKVLGFAIRSNQNINATLGITNGYSLNVSQYQTMAILKYGSAWCKLSAIIGSGAVAQWANVYIDNTTGAIAIYASGATTGYTKLNWLFKSSAAQLIVNSIVEISTDDQNTQIVS